MPRESGAHSGRVRGQTGVPRGSPRFPALPTPRRSDIRGSRGLIMQQARRGACVRAWGAGPPGGSRVALTLLKFIQAAGAAEGAHGGRLPAAASLHPRGWEASEQPGATWRRHPGLAPTRAQLGGPPGGGGGRSRVQAPRYQNAPLPPARHPVHEPVNPVGAAGSERRASCTAAAPFSSPECAASAHAQPARPCDPQATRDLGAWRTPYLNVTF